MIKKCLFPAAGYGTRFLPATKAMPKEMLPVVNKPLIQYGVEEALAAGLTQIAMVTGRGKRSLEDHFDISYELEHQIRNTDKEKYLVGIRRLIDECSFSYTRQVEMKGLGHAILSGRPLIGDEPYPVGYYCGVRDPAGNYVEFSYGQPLGPGAEDMPEP
ncbi:sugar phosphate nucleotidyltransferase [Methylobacterium organophilum]|nr:sugar phosphate nucleotidyltransferase [Methylobacterium organophilum]